jgi:hypothetical protein
MRADYSPNFIKDYVDIPGTPVTITPVFDKAVIPANFVQGGGLPNGMTYVPSYDRDWKFNVTYGNLETSITPPAP